MIALPATYKKNTAKTANRENLGNDSDEGSDKEIVRAPKVVDKPLSRTGKRNGHEADPGDSWGGQTAGDRGGRGGRGRGGYGNEAGMLLLSGI